MSVPCIPDTIDIRDGSCSAPRQTGKIGAHIYNYMLTWRWFGVIIWTVLEPLQYLALTAISLPDSLLRTVPHAEQSGAKHGKEIVSSNIQLLYARRPALNWFLSEREASLSTDTQPCFPHLPHPTQITAPSAPLLRRVGSLSIRCPLSCSAHLRTSSYRRLARAPAPVHYLSLISAHCNGKWFCVLALDWSSEPAPRHHCHLGVGGVFNFAPLSKLPFIKEFISVRRFNIFTRLFVSGLKENGEAN